MNKTYVDKFSKLIFSSKYFSECNQFHENNKVFCIKLFSYIGIVSLSVVKVIKQITTVYRKLETAGLFNQFISGQTQH